MTAGAPRSFYLIAIGGTAMAPLATLLAERGERVDGSDLPLYPPMSDRIAALGIAVRPGFSAANLPDGIDHVVVGNLAARDNPELVEAQRRGLPVASMPETLRREILAGRHPVVVAGTHGKTTTSALTAWLLASAGREPGYLIGGEPLDLPSPAAIGQGAAFVVEGDEYSTSYADKGPKFLHYAPRTLILTSVEFDHGDLYADLDAVKAAFRRGVALVPPYGRIVANGDDPNVLEVLDAARAPVTLYRVLPDGARTGADLLAVDVTLGPDGTRFTVLAGGEPLLIASTRLAGRHNVANALAAIGAARGFGVSPGELAIGLATFRGVKRRLEEKGTANGVTVLDDFAHHPTAVATTVEGARRRYAGRRLWAVFEPRSITGGREEFHGAYRAALGQADGVALAAPYHATRLGADALDVERLVAELTADGKMALTAKDAASLADALLSRLAPGDVVLAMSSGSFGGIHARLLEGLRRAE